MRKDETCLGESAVTTRAEDRLLLLCKEPEEFAGAVIATKERNHRDPLD